MKKSVLSVLFLFGIITRVLTGMQALPSTSNKKGHLPKTIRIQEDSDTVLPSYEIITPAKVTQDGGFLSNDLTHTYEYKSGDFGKRRKRETSNNEKRDSKIHYSLFINGKHHMLELQPNHAFLASHAVVERRSKFDSNSHEGEVKIGPMTSKVSTIGTLPRCHFTGRVFNHTNSKVALSACKGLKGYLKTDGGEFIIEPLEDVNRTSNQPHPHKIYRKFSTSFDSKSNGEENSKCATKQFAEAIKARRMWEENNDYLIRKTQDDKDNIEGNAKSKYRWKRSISVERNVEVLVVADKMMIDFYSNEDLNTYILTVMNMVSSIFHDASIGNAINIIVVRIMLLETPQYEEELDISHHADNTLLSFCKWQGMINPSSEEHPYHHDLAVLLTRYNICSQSANHCSTLGLAEIAGMCQPNRSCNVNEDTGLQMAYTIAHEIGHNFGMSHDSLGNGCGDPYGISQHVMSPHLASDTFPMTWSNCSRDDITNFLDRDWGRCLVDQPHEVEYNFPQLPPGAMYDADHQCRLAFGAKAYHCKEETMECHTLWCRVKNRCITRLEPAADGTQCGKHKWCYHGKCVTMGERPEAIHGSWGEWSPWSACSRSCGAGVKVASRHCNNPPPSNGGKYCTGDRRKYLICNIEECPDNGVSFRAIQCSEFNNKTYEGKNHTWTPVTLESNPCQLQCKPDNEFYAVELKATVEDGTPCKPGTRDMCIHGICKRIACDWTIEGSAQEDRCGLCHGDGTQCLTTTGVFNETHSMSYVKIVTLPVGSKSARVDELGNAANYLAVKDETTGEFYLNGNWIIQWSGEYSASGVMIYYKRDNETESLFFPGPLKKSLTIMMLFQTDNPGVQWEYTIPQENVTYNPEFSWKSSYWSVCTRTCGGGTQWSKGQCMEKEAGLVEDKYCENKTRPEDEIRACNTHVCPAWWWSGPWQPCSVTCGINGSRKRTVICVRSYGPTEQMALMDSDCSMNQKPHDEEECPGLSICPVDLSWSVGSWIETCSNDPCEIQRRSVVCNAAEGSCDPLTKPSDTRQCGNITCGYWQVDEWGECSTSCGEGFQIRNVQCLNGVACTQATKPGSVKECKLNDCDYIIIEKPASEIQAEINPNLSSNNSSSSLQVNDSSEPTPQNVLETNDTAIQEADQSSAERGEAKPIDSDEEKVTNIELTKNISFSSSENTALETEIFLTQNEMFKETSNNKSEVNIDYSNLQKEEEETLNTNGTIFFLPNVTSDVETPQTKKEKENIKSKEVGLEQGQKMKMKNFNETNEKEVFHKSPKKIVLEKEEIMKLSNVTVDDDSPFYYEATPDEYYDYNATENAPSEGIADLPKQERWNTSGSIDDDTIKNNGEKVEEVDENLNITIIKNETDFKNEGRSNEAETILEHYFEDENQNKHLKEKESNNTFLRNQEDSNVVNTTTKLMKNNLLTETENEKPTMEVFSKFKETKNDSKPKEFYDDIDYNNYNDFYNFSSHVFYNDDTTSNFTKNVTLVERPQGYVDDKIDVDNVQVIEIKLKKNRRRQQKKKKKKMIKKIKVHTGAKAIRVINKFTKKANAKQSSVSSPKLHDSQGDSFTSILKWNIGPWMECSEPCGTGIQRRTIECQNSSLGTVVPSLKCGAQSPPDTRDCNKFPCLNWTVSPFGPCSATCGSGTRMRNVTCPKDGQCHVRDIPPLQEECVEQPCEQWVQGPWSMCTKSCGDGYQIRLVKCVQIDTQETSQDCKNEDRPPHKRACNNNICPQKRQSHHSHCQDSLDTKLCRRLVHMCSKKFIRVKCCQTCHREKG